MPKLNTIAYTFKSVLDASARFGVGYRCLLGRLWYLYATGKFSPQEVFFNDLLDPRIPKNAIRHYVSKQKQISLDEMYLLKSYMCLVSDKAVFYSYCKSVGLPVPSLLAVFDIPVGWTGAGKLLSSPEEWAEFINSLPQDFIVKPALGLMGVGVTAFHRGDVDYVDQTGRTYGTHELYEFLCGRKEDNLFAGDSVHHSLKLKTKSYRTIIQERVFAHSAIGELTQSVSLCTCRIMTLFDPRKGVDVVATAFRVISGKNIVDNLDRGATGNIWCSVDPNSGVVLEAFAKAPEADRLRLVGRHPVTGMGIVGFKIPLWQEAIDLAIRSASTFAPQRLVTWDIGITQEGPLVIEGNFGGGFLPTPLNVPVDQLLNDS